MRHGTASTIMRNRAAGKGIFFIMLLLDFINVGNGDSILIREMRGDTLCYALLVDCGHYALVRDDHPQEPDPRSKRIFAGEFLQKCGVNHLDMLLLTHFHRDHAGGLGRVLDTADVEQLATTYVPPAGYPSLHPDADNELPTAARNVLRCMDFFTSALREHPGKVHGFLEWRGDHTESLALTEELSMDVYFTGRGVYEDQRRIFDAAFRGERNRYDLMHWSRFMNVSSLRQRLFYHGKEIVLGGDTYGVLWDRDSTMPCDILKLPHHGSVSSATAKFLRQLQPKTIVVSVAGGRPDGYPNPAIIAMLKEFTDDIRFTDAVDIPGLVQPVFHESVHMEIP